VDENAETRFAPPFIILSRRPYLLFCIHGKRRAAQNKAHNKAEQFDFSHNGFSFSLRG
jgi:hypothetical protein